MKLAYSIEYHHEKDTTCYITLCSVICIIVSFCLFDNSIN
ncbi:putative membrane protein [Shigella flexneri 2850-71]|nr:putative membrane protein [Shigella flexneri 2850-71]